MEQTHADPLAAREPFLVFFYGAHLSEPKRSIVAPFGQLARDLVESHQDNRERLSALRLLLDAKNATLRAAGFHDC